MLLVALCLALSASEAQGESEIVVRVGSSSLSIKELEKRLSELPRSEIDALGATDQERVKGFVEHYVVPEFILAEAAKQRGLLEQPSFHAQRNEVLRRTLETVLRDEARATIGKAEVQELYAAERQRLDTPAGILIWRILVDDPELAQRILSEAKGVGGPERWRALAREHSLDTATNMRGGMLGFVHADGKTDVPQLEVDPALFAAANAVKDGELVAKPIPEGKHLALIWRRGSRAARMLPAETLEPRLFQVLLRQKLNQALALLIDKLRKERLKNLNSERIEQITYPLPSFTPRDAFPKVTAEPSAGKLQPPEPSDRGLR